MARYKVTKEQLEMVVESFVMENSKKENKTQLDEVILGGEKIRFIDMVLGDFVKSLKKAIAKIKPEIAKMAKEDPDVMADLKSAAKITSSN